MYAHIFLFCFVCLGEMYSNPLLRQSSFMHCSYCTCLAICPEHWLDNLHPSMCLLGLAFFKFYSSFRFQGWLPQVNTGPPALGMNAGLLCLWSMWHCVKITSQCSGTLLRFLWLSICIFGQVLFDTSIGLLVYILNEHYKLKHYETLWVERAQLASQHRLTT